MAKEKKKKSDIIITIVILLVAAGFIVALLNMVLGFFKNDSKTKDSQKTTEIQQLTTKNLDAEYPATPREVVKVYCKITKNLYYGNCEEDEIEKLFNQMRKLFDAELLDSNEYEKHLKTLKKDLEDYKKSKMKVVSYALQDIDDIETYTIDGRENALVKATFSLKEKNKWKKVNEEFVVRKDEEGRWKIYGWQTSNTALDKDEEE